MARLLVSCALSNGLSCETGSFSYCRNCHSPQPPLSPLKSALPKQPTELSSQPCPLGAPRHCSFSELALAVHCLTGLVVLIDFFFNSFVVGVLCSLIFWHLWWFIDFRLVVILLLVVRGSKGSLPMPPSWPEPVMFFFKNAHFVRTVSTSQQN